MKWATVTDDSPLRIRLDGDTDALPYTPDALVDPAALAVDDRVRCELADRRVVIVGKSGGDPTLAAAISTLTADVDGLDSAIAAINNRTAEGSKYVADGVLTAAYVTYVTESITVVARPVTLIVSAIYRNGNSGANRTVDIRIQEDGVTIPNGEILGLFSEFLSGGSTPTSYCEAFVLTPAAGVRSYTVQIKASVNSAVFLQRASIAAIES